MNTMSSLFYVFMFLKVSIMGQSDGVLIIIGKTYAGASSVLPVVFFNDSSDLKFLGTEIEDKYFLMNTIKSSYKLGGKLNLQAIDSIILKLVIRDHKKSSSSKSTKNPQLQIVRYSGAKYFSIQIYDNDLAVQLIKQFILELRKFDANKKMLDHFEKIKRESLYNYD